MTRQCVEAMSSMKRSIKEFTKFIPGTFFHVFAAFGEASTRHEMVTLFPSGDPNMCRGTSNVGLTAKSLIKAKTKEALN